MMKGYEKKGNFEGMNTWQLMQKVYLSLVTESRSLATMIAAIKDKKGAEKTALNSAIVKSNYRINSVVRFLDSLLIEGDSFSSNMAGLYDWYLKNLEIVMDSRSGSDAVATASDNLVTQAEGFVDIWRTTKSA